MEEKQRMRHRGWSVVLPGALLLLTLRGASAHPPAKQGAPSPTREKIEELAALGRLWGEVKFIHPWLYSRDIDWDAALLFAIPGAIEARGPEEFRAVVAELLAALDDPVTRVEPPAALEASHVVESPAALERDGSGAVLVRAPVSGAGTEVLRRLAREPLPTGVIFDLRGTVEDGALEAHRAALEAALNGLVHGSCRMPSWRNVKYSGYPPEKGQSSGGYTLEFKVSPPRTLEGRAEQAIPLVFVVDERLRGVGDHLLALQLAGLATIVLESQVENLDDREDGVALVHFELPRGMRAQIRANERIGPSGETGFRPDVHLRPGADAGEALRQARAILSGELTAKRPEYARAPGQLVRRPERDYTNLEKLGPEHRLLSLFRYWCTLWNFWPYQPLLERPWEETLVDFLPRFLAAEDAPAYERAVAELVACTEDSHSHALSRTLLQLFGVTAPKLTLQFVEDRPVVVAVHDPAIADVSVGDVLLSVDGVRVEERIETLRPLMAHSTPQAFHDMLRDVLMSGGPGTLARASFEGPHGVRECSLARGEEYVQCPRTTPVFGVLPSGHGYVDLARLEEEQIPAAFDAVADAPSLVFDLRGYPNGTAPSVALRLGEGNGPVAAVFYRNQIGADGPGVRSRLRMEQHVDKRPAGVRAFEGPVVVLIDERAISQAEHCCLF